MGGFGCWFGWLAFWWRFGFAEVVAAERIEAGEPIVVIDGKAYVSHGGRAWIDEAGEVPAAFLKSEVWEIGVPDAEVGD